MKEQIIQKYLEGSSISQLLNEFPGYNRRDINKILADNNITIRGGRKKKTLTEEQIQEVTAMIKDGAFLKEVAEHCNLDTATMRLRLKELDLKITNTNRVNRHIKSDYFSVIDDPVKAYWLGFLYTDGSVDNYRGLSRIRLQLQEQDKEILEKFQKDLGLKNKIIYDRRGNSVCCSVEFVDKQIFQDLSKYNIIPNKTYATDKIPFDLIPDKYQSAFLLGLFDGDGSLSCSQNFSTDVTLNYTAYHEKEVLDFQKAINKLCDIKNTNKVFFTSAWHAQWRGRLQVLLILDTLYKDCPRFLLRKYNKYIALKNSLN